jgi:hypothetical protein
LLLPVVYYNYKYDKLGPTESRLGICCQTWEGISHWKNILRQISVIQIINLSMLFPACLQRPSALVHKPKGVRISRIRISIILHIPKKLHDFAVDRHMQL